MAKNKKGAPAPRGAKNARGGRGGRGGRGASRGRGHYSPAPARVSFIREETAGFTLADEARHTSQHDPSIWNNLRKRPVKFVSAGPTEPLKVLDVLLDDTIDEAGEPTTVPPPENHTQRDPQINTQDGSGNEADHHDAKGGHEADAEEESGEDDQFIGPDELEEAIQAQVEPEPETAEAPSFFFDLKGDQSQPKPQQGPVEIPDRPSSRSSSSSEEVILFRGRGVQRKTQPAEEISMIQMQTEIRIVEQAIATEPASAPLSHAPELAVEPPNRKKLDKKEKKQKRQYKRNAQLRFEEEEDAILADYIANMKENSDDDYFRQLVQGGRDSDATEEDASDSADAAPKRQRASHKPTDADAGDSDGDQEGDLSEDEGEDDEDASEIDEATLAKLIAGQELTQDLGMEDVNFGDSSSDSDSSSDEKAAKRSQIINDDLDLMDWERPSLRRRKGKGARAQVNFNVSDSELEAQLQAAWKNDRQKKSERKKQREELRALGMLGKKANPEDLRFKYPDGMNMEQVAEELRVFLMNSDDQLMLPPMDNHARKMIHELAGKFKIKSKSTGKADQRRPTLYRTGRTLPYVEATFDQAVSRINRRYFPRLDMRGKKSNRLPPVRGGAGLAAATYADGEIVGGSAPELGVENRGRAMLEKMGWSSGTALGAMNNKGILQPVTHAMKRSKAGLG